MALPRLGAGIPGHIRAEGGDIRSLGLLARQLVDCGFLRERDWTPDGLRGSIQRAFSSCVIESGCADLDHFDVDLFYGAASRIFANESEPERMNVDLLPWHARYFAEGCPVRALAPMYSLDHFGGVALWHGGTRSVFVESTVRSLERTITGARKRGVAGAQAVSPKVGYDLFGLVELMCDWLLPCGTPLQCHDWLRSGMFDESILSECEDEEDAAEVYEERAWMIEHEFRMHLPPSLLHRQVVESDGGTRGNSARTAMRLRAARSLKAALPFFTRPGSRPLLLPSGMSAEALVQAGLDLLEIYARLRRGRKSTPTGSQYYNLSYYTREETVWPTMIRWSPQDWIGRVVDFYHENALEAGLNECVWWRGWHLQAGPLLGEKNGQPHPQSVAGVVASLRLFLPALAALNRVLSGLDHLPGDGEEGSLVEDRAHKKILSQMENERRAARAQANHARARVRVR